MTVAQALKRIWPDRGFTQQRELDRARLLLGDEGSAGDGKKSEARAEQAHAPQQLKFLEPAFRYAALTPQEARALTLVAVVGVVGTLLLLVLLRQPLLLLVPGGVLYAEYRWLKRQAFVRAEKFERDFTALLLSLASAVRTGLDPLVALTESVHLFSPQSEVSKEISKFNEALERGENEEEATRLFGATIDHPDVKLFQTAFIISRREGASLAHCLIRLARVTRNRQSFRRKVRASVAMQKLSSIGIACCAVFIVIVQALTNWEGVYTALHHPLGSKLLMLGGLLVATGLTWMMRMSRTRI